MTSASERWVLDPEDEYPHTPDPVPHYNESMYLNAFDLTTEVGAWFRLGNRVNEGHAEMTVCLYLPGGRVGFMYGRPTITANDAMDAGGLRIEVVEPFRRLEVTYSGRVVVLADPGEMADPRAAFSGNPHLPCQARMTFTGVSPMYGGRPADPVAADEITEHSFARAHYEQHGRMSGTVTVGDEVIPLDGFGLRDKSWGPRYWQAIAWYRWLPMVFGEDFAMMLSVQGRGSDGADVHRGGMVLRDGRYHSLRGVEIDSEWDDRGHQRAMRCRATSDLGGIEVYGEVISLIPLRNRRTDASGNLLHTRITEAMTRFTCEGRTGLGMSEYLDQVVDGRPVGPDLPRRG